MAGQAISKISDKVTETPFQPTLKVKASRPVAVKSRLGLADSDKPVTHAQVLDFVLERLEKCEFAAAAERNGKELADLKQRDYLVLSIGHLLETVSAHNFALARKNDFVFVYNGQYWKEIDRETLRDFLGQASEKMGTNVLDARHYKYKDELYKQFLSSAHFKQVEADPGRVLINLQNGTFEVSASGQSLRDFQAADFLRHQLPFAYDENAQAPMFMAYLHQVLPEIELQQLLAEFVGYVFTRSLKLEKALLLYGSGANGKSVFFDVMNALLGRENTANFSLADLMEEHNRALIANKLLNYGSEINAKVTRDLVKILISGEPVMARLKYGNSFLMEHYAKLCFNCNELPKDIEQTEAYFRRLIIVPFRVTIPESQQDKELAQKIIANELSGVFNWVLSGLNRLLKQKRFTSSEIARQAVEAYRQESDSVACFVSESEPKPEGLLKTVYKDYRDYCLDSGLKPLGKLNFRKRLEGQGYGIEKAEAGMRVFLLES